jgi:hypothetical protein
MADPSLYTTVVPTAIGVTALTIGAFRRQYMWRRNKAAERAKLATIATQLVQGPPEGAVFVQQGALPIPKDFVITGTTMHAGNGSVGCMRVADGLIALARIGAEASVGSIILNECDEQTRRRISARIPSVYHDRVVFAFAPDFQQGFGNLPPDRVETLYGRWSVPLKDAVEQVAKRHEERNGAKPGQIIFFTSLGGHAFPGVTMAEELHDRFPDARMLGVINLPRKQEQREYFLTLKNRYEHAGIVGWLGSDRMEQDNVTQDTVISDIMAGFEAASIASDGAVRLNNVVTGVTGNEGGGVALYEYIYGEVVAHRFQPDPNQLPRYYVYRQQVISELRNLIEMIECGRGKGSLAMPVATDKRQTYDLALCAVGPNDMLAIRDYVERAREEDDTQLAGKGRPHLHPKPNYESVFASWPQSIDPEKPRCQVCVIRLRPIQNAPGMLDELVKVPAARRQAIPSTPYAPAIPASTNGEFDKF